MNWPSYRVPASTSWKSVPTVSTFSASDRDFCIFLRAPFMKELKAWLGSLILLCLYSLGWKISQYYHFCIIFCAIGILKGTATLMISMFYQKLLHEPWILIQVSSTSVEKWASYGHLKNSIWPRFSRHFEYLISLQNFFNCLIFSYHYYHIICVSADM